MLDHKLCFADLQRFAIVILKINGALFRRLDDRIDADTDSALIDSSHGRKREFSRHRNYAGYVLSSRLLTFLVATTDAHSSIISDKHKTLNL